MPHTRVVQQLCTQVMSAQSGTARVLVAVAGQPGAGKSTLAADLVLALRAQTGENNAALVPMDGFHLDNEELRLRGLLARKGAPETFDTSAFFALVAAVREDKGDLTYPLFDRAFDKTLSDAATLPTAARIVVFEGNYLLLQQGLWAALSGMFDVSVLLSVPLPVLRARLVARWLEHGLTKRDAEARAMSNDMVNARTVRDHSAPADLTLITQSDGQITIETRHERDNRAG